MFRFQSSTPVAGILLFFGLTMYIIYSGPNTGLQNSGRPKPAAFLENEMTVPRLVEDVTIVTAYFNLGSFQKGGKDHVVGVSNYLEWMKVYGRIINPVLAFFDDEDILDAFVKLRENFPDRTRAFLLNRHTLWSFQIIDRIRQIFEQPGYPKHLPNTVVPEYSCAMHAKFELLRKAAKANYFNTAYISWLDIGLFRFDTGGETFGLWLPPDFDANKVSYTRVGPFNAANDIKTIIYSNSVWVSGAMNLATVENMHRFANDYLKFVNYSLDQMLISTDQQAIYGMYTNGIPPGIRPSSKLQLHSEGNANPYFRLGYICRQAWESKTETHRAENP